MLGVLALRCHVNDHGQAASARGFRIVVGRVVSDVTVDQPLPRSERPPENIVPLPRTNVDGIRLEPCFRSKRDTIARNDGKGAAMNVHGVNKDIVAADKTRSYRLSDFQSDGFGGRIGLPVDRKVVG